MKKSETCSTTPCSQTIAAAGTDLLLYHVQGALCSPGFPETRPRQHLFLKPVPRLTRGPHESSPYTRLAMIAESQLVGAAWSMQDVRHWSLFVKVLINKCGHKTKEWPDLAMWCVQARFATDARPLSQILQPAVSPTFEFVTHLRLHDGFECPVRDIVSLTAMVNLGVLEIIQPLGQPNHVEFPRVTDAVVREWASMKNPFPLLRILRIWGEDFTSYRSLQYLSSFPSLAVYDVAGHRDDWPKATEVPISWTMKRHASSSRALEELVHIYKGLDKTTAHLVTEEQMRLRICAQVMTLGTSNTLPIEMDKKIELGKRKLSVVSSHLGASITPQEPSDERLDRFWGLLTYCHIGEVSKDADFMQAGLSAPFPRPHIGALKLPSRPVVTIRSVHGARNSYQYRSLTDPSKFARHCTFTRSQQMPKAQPTASPSSTSRRDGENVLEHSVRPRRPDQELNVSKGRKLRRKANISLQDFM
ncbi:uncharacterized protein B0I36DRAFT_395090 [Microdochium trichocladiopsis]|uniref:Uncharacterized protein n=1 Tax=Microdochium trichocladiopsis TaxID=1682393 RepID=A0A9P8XUF1_9PEZI|nr:uncharacterized protein B0I36DRAFT_395090 [Microdochium trichocladiopsis]KAH7018293.1 hypothetical protein B0I36DRAFT_395090 [Microdochium trichocladiopsis]